MSPYGNPDLVGRVDLTNLPEEFEYLLGVNFYSVPDYEDQGLGAEDDSWERIPYPSTQKIRSCDKQQARLDHELDKKKRKRNKKKIKKLRERLKKCLKKRKRDIKKTEGRSKEGLEDLLRKAIIAAIKKGVQLIVPEFAVVNYAPGADKYVDDLTDVFDENGISSFWHILFESPYWDPLKLCDPVLASCEDQESSDLFDSLVEYFVSSDFD